MSLTHKTRYLPLIFLVVLLLGFISVYPLLLANIIEWQREFNRLISDSLERIQQHQQTAGAWLVLVSFLYGFFHAVGPGHGKFIIAGYLATNPLHLKTSLRLTLFSSLMQGVVAIGLTSILVVLLTLSSAYFKLTQLWLERFSFAIMIGLGCYWLSKDLLQRYCSDRQQSKSTNSPTFKTIHSIQPVTTTKIGLSAIQQTASHSTGNQCGCGHQHIPQATQLSHSTNWKAQLMIVISIGMRPCSGAILVLFLSYMLDLYLWGIIAVIAMSIGTALVLSLLALLVLYARNHAVRIGQWYFSPELSKQIMLGVRLLFGFILISMGATLLYASSLPVSGGAALFAR